MLKVVRRSAVHGLCAAVALALWPVTATAQAEPDSSGAQAFPTLPLPPAIEGLIGMPQTYTAARSSYLALITSEAEQRGLPAALADAVAQVESRYSANAVGSLGEVGLMQIRPRTAALLGYKGEAAGLAEPETNVRLGVAYLARAWQLAKGDVCRALMKYRAGWGEERMSPLSVEYCRRARSHLAAIGSPLADEAQPTSQEPATAVVAQPNQKLSPAPIPVAARPQPAAPQLAAVKQTQVEPVPLPPVRLASLGTAEPARDLGQARSKAPETKAALSSSSMVSQRMAASFGIEFPDGVVDGLIEIVRSGEGLVSEVMPLQVAPETLDIVQLRSVFRQPLDPEPMSPLGEGGTSRLAGVDRTVVEDQNEGLDRDAELGTIAAVDLLQESKEVRASFGSASVNNEL